MIFLESLTVFGVGFGASFLTFLPIKIINLNGLSFKFPQQKGIHRSEENRRSPQRRKTTSS